MGERDRPCRVCVSLAQYDTMVQRPMLRDDEALIKQFSEIRILRPACSDEEPGCPTAADWRSHFPHTAMPAIIIERISRPSGPVLP